MANLAKNGLAVLLLLGCAPPAPDVATVSQPIVDGVPTSTEDDLRLHLAKLQRCTGVLVRNDWVLTAGHCAPDASPWEMVAFGDETQLTDAVYVFGNLTTLTGTPDLALYHVSQGFMVGGSRTGFRLPIRSQAPGPAESVVVCGQGGNVEPNHSDGFGTMRCGVMASSPARDAAGNAILNLYPLAFLGQILAPGDSGGPVFFDEALVGINSESGSEMSVAVSVPEAAAWIDGVTASSWAASARVQWIDVRLAEIQGTNQPWTDVAATPWAQANRSAQEVCTRRGYTGGFYTGEALGDRRGVVCLGNEIAQFFDVPQTEIDQLPEPFVDVDTVPWAQAQRMADKLCIARGLPHGFFTGHHVDYYLNGQLLLPWVRGLVCQSHSFHWRDVDPQTLSSSSAQPISSVDALDWGTAARAATRYCWNRGYASEYFSGWQSPQGLGTVCIATAPPRVDEITAQPTTPGGRAQLEFNGLFEGGADLALVLYQCVFPVTDARIEWSTRNQLRVSLSAPYGNFCYFGVYRGDGESTYLKPFWVPAGTPLPSGPPAFCVVTGTC